MLILPVRRVGHGENQEAIAKAAEFLAAGVPVAAICAATWPSRERLPRQPPPHE